jgi:cytidylate kinase
MKVFEKRPKDMGKLFVVGGPGGTGSSTIARMLAVRYGLHYIYGGQFMRNIAKEKGFASVEDFLQSLEGSSDRYQYDRMIDEKLLKMSYKPNVLIDSKVFAALATVNRIPCTVRVWLTSDVETRVRRTLNKMRKLDLKNSLEKTDPLYRETMEDLMKRYSNDKNRYQKLYGVDYDKPNVYNDIVIDSSKLDAHQTFNLIIKKIEDGGYLER